MTPHSGSAPTYQLPPPPKDAITSIIRKPDVLTVPTAVLVVTSAPTGSAPTSALVITAEGRHRLPRLRIIDHPNSQQVTNCRSGGDVRSNWIRSQLPTDATPSRIFDHASQNGTGTPTNPDTSILTHSHACSVDFFSLSFIFLFLTSRRMLASPITHAQREPLQRAN
jgi:hypothetical protein